MLDFLKDAFDFVAKPVTEVVKFAGDVAREANNFINGDQAAIQRNEKEKVQAQLAAQTERNLRLEQQNAMSMLQTGPSSYAQSGINNRHSEPAHGLPAWLLPVGVGLGVVLVGAVVYKAVK